MSLMDNLTALGLRPPQLISGFLGGLVAAFVMRNARPGEAFISVVIGGVTANYLAPAFERVMVNTLGFSFDLGAAGFIVGIGGMTIVQGIFGEIRKRFTSQGLKLRLPPEEHSYRNVPEEEGQIDEGLGGA